MKNITSIIILTTLCSLATYTSTAYQVIFQSNHRSGIAYLAYYMGPNFNIEDSAAVDKKGQAIFKNNRKLPGGIYAVVFADKRYSVEFLLDKEQNINIVADTASLLKAAVTGSKENLLFQAYQRYTAEIGKSLSRERTAYLKATNKADSSLHEANYIRLNTELNNYRLRIMKSQPSSLMASLLNAMRESPYPAKPPVTRQDSLDNYNFYKAHYWDGISFMDDRIVRTPFFLPKLERYYREVIGQSEPDSLIKDIDYKLLLARTAPEMYKFLLNWLTDEYITPKYMGQDAIFVHLFNNYHSKGLSPWLNAKQMETISRRAYMQMSNLIGEKAANLHLVDTAGNPRDLYDVEADYTIVLFWDPTCGHCKEELPRIDSIYRGSWKSKNVKIYAVLTEKLQREWMKYISDHNLQDWINVYQTKEMEEEERKAQRPGFRQLFDVIMTPTVFLLDKEKRIIGKKLSWQQINDLLEVKRSKGSKQKTN